MIPAATVARAVAALAERGYVGRGYLGLALQPLRDAGGLIVVEVSAGGPAAAAGFLVGDIVTTWDGEGLRSMRQLARRLDTDTIGPQRGARGDPRRQPDDRRRDGRRAAPGARRIGS